MLAFRQSQLPVLAQVGRICKGFGLAVGVGTVALGKALQRISVSPSMRCRVTSSIGGRSGLGVTTPSCHIIIRLFLSVFLMLLFTISLPIPTIDLLTGLVKRLVVSR